MQIPFTPGGIMRALRATSAGLALSLVHVALVTAAGVALNWGFIAFAARALAGDWPRAEAALNSLPVPMSLWLLVPLIGVAIPMLYVLIGQRQGVAAATRRIYSEYREDVLAGLVTAWRQQLTEAGGHAPDRRALRRAREGWDQLPAPVRGGLTRLMRLPRVRAALAAATEEARGRTDGSDTALVLALVERRLSESVLGPAYLGLWLLLAGNVALLLGSAAALGLW